MTGYLKFFSARNQRKAASGNALVYVLIVIALFAGLGYTLSRQSDSDETAMLTEARTRILATDIQELSARVKQAVDMMVFSGTAPENILFHKPGSADYDTDSIRNLYHPDGGGLNLPPLAQDAFAPMTTLPRPGIYVDRFNNFDWTPSTDQDVVLTFYDLREPVCAALNRTITGSSDIPVLTGPIQNYIVVGGSGLDMTSAVCPDCEGMFQFCVTDGTTGKFGYYVILIAR